MKSEEAVFTDFNFSFTTFPRQGFVKVFHNKTHPLGFRINNNTLWYDDPRCVQTRTFCKKHLDSAVYREKIKKRSDETIANIAITLIHQCDVLIRGLIEWKKREFKEKGGIKEEMYRARRDWQQRNGYGGRHGQYGADGQKPSQPIKPSTPKE